MKKTVLISPFAQHLRNGKQNPKNFPHWKELVALLINANMNVIQIGSSKDTPVEGVTEFKRNLKLAEIKDLVAQCDIWISVDSFLQHLNHFYKGKPGIVIFSQSDPRIFGYNENNNLLKNRSYLRDKQYWLWEQCDYNADAFVTAEVVFDTVQKSLEVK